MTIIQDFLTALRQPEYRPVLLNPLPVYGLAAGLLGLVTGLFARSTTAQRVGLLLVLVLLTTLSVWPVVESGHAGYHRAHDLV